jgi:hypothetical protein
MPSRKVFDNAKDLYLRHQSHHCPFEVEGQWGEIPLGKELGWRADMRFTGIMAENLFLILALIGLIFVAYEIYELFSNINTLGYWG